MPPRIHRSPDLHLRCPGRLIPLKATGLRIRRVAVQAVAAGSGGIQGEPSVHDHEPGGIMDMVLGDPGQPMRQSPEHRPRGVEGAVRLGGRLTTCHGQCEQAVQQDACGPTRVLGRMPPTAKVAATTSVLVAGEAGSWFGWSESVRQWKCPPVGASGNRAVSPSVFVSQSNSPESSRSEMSVVWAGSKRSGVANPTLAVFPDQSSGMAYNYGSDTF